MQLASERFVLISQLKRSIDSRESSVMVATGQEMVREKKILQGQGNVREFYSGSGKIGILKKSQGKLKL